MASRLESLISLKGGIAIHYNQFEKYFIDLNPELKEFIKKHYNNQEIDYDINNENNRNKISLKNNKNISNSGIRIKKTIKHISKTKQLKKFKGVIFDDIYNFKLK